MTLCVIRSSQDSFSVFQAGSLLFSLRTWRNPLHAGHLYLELCPDCGKVEAASLFSALRQVAGCPLQIMLDSDDPQIPWLLTGGFQRRCRCLEFSATTAELRAPLPSLTAPLLTTRGTAQYQTCCRLLYTHYRQCHQSVNPLTATLEEFQAVLPEMVCYGTDLSGICHCAFLVLGEDEWEIAYLATTAQPTFPAFAEALLSFLFRKTRRITMECDDTDPAAMALETFFCLDRQKTFDTYILP